MSEHQNEANAPRTVLTRVTIQNFKRLENVTFELGPVTVLCGPNNSGKTTALQALSLWQAGLRQWQAKRSAQSNAEHRPGVPINRRDLVSLPVPATNLLWYGRRTHIGFRDAEGRQRTEYVHLGITVEGVTGDTQWQCGLEFDYPNSEAVYCRPLRLETGRSPKRMPIPIEAHQVKIAALPPMSGLAIREPRLDRDYIDTMIGEGQTAQVLRNLCFIVFEENPPAWSRLVSSMRTFFGIIIEPPIKTGGQIFLSYLDEENVQLDLSSTGRGLQQALLLLAYLFNNPNTVLLLDEPDAHLEIIRQRNIYNQITDIAESQNCQIIAASHSEVVLQEAAMRHVVVSFVGAPHRIDDRGTQLRKWLSDYPIDHLYQAERNGWVLYLEGSTDLAILSAFAETLDHPVLEFLRAPFTIYVANDTQQVNKHFPALREAKPDISGVALFDRLDRGIPSNMAVPTLMWQQREIENYFCTPDILMEWSRRQFPDSLFEARHRETMRTTIEKVESAQKIALGIDIWSPDVKATDAVLDPIFRNYYDSMGTPMLFRKTDYHHLARMLARDQICPEIAEKLDAIYEAVKLARPRKA